MANIGQVLESAAGVLDAGIDTLTELQVIIIKGDTTIIGVFDVDGDEREITASGKTPAEAAEMFQQRCTVPRTYDTETFTPVIVPDEPAPVDESETPNA